MRWSLGGQLGRGQLGRGQLGRGQLGRGRRGRGPAGDAARAEEHLTDFASSRRGVEGFIEPETAQTGTTLVLVAVDGEWTRRLLPAPDAVRLCRRLGLPVYDVHAVGYPPRMRAWSAQQRGQ